MISKTIGYNGVHHFQTHPSGLTMLSTYNWHQLERYSIIFHLWILISSPSDGLEKIWVRQLGWWNSHILWKDKKCSKPPTSIYVPFPKQMVSCFQNHMSLHFILVWLAQKTSQLWVSSGSQIYIQCEAPKIAKLVNITPMSLWFMVFITN